MVNLPNADEPLVLADGTVINPDGSVRKPNVAKQPKVVEIPSNRQAVEIVTKTRRKLTDLPSEPKAMNGIAAVVTYTLFGLTNEEIAIALSIPEEQVARIKEQGIYDQLRRDVIASIMEAETLNVRDIFTSNAQAAARKIVDALHEDETSFVAAKEILDRAGHRPADMVEHIHRLDGSLRIEVIKKSNNANIPVIELLPSEDNENVFGS